MKVVMASNNAHKIAELRAILSAYGLDVVSQREAGVHVEPEETGTTFEENSRIKAVAVMQACGLPAVADDSGLMETAASAMIRCSLRRMPGARSQNWPRSRKIRYPTAPGRCAPLWKRRLERKRRRNYADQQTARRSARTG